MKLLAHKPARATLSIFLFLVTIFSFLSTPAPIRAAMPERNYVLAQMFSILRYIRPPLLRVYENRDRDRTYPPLMVCTYSGALRLADECVSGPGADAMCTGEADICRRQDGGFDHTIPNVKGKCKVPKVVDSNGDKHEPPPGTVGKCDYTANPRITSTILSTDYSNDNKSTIVYPKLQNEASYYDNIGDENLISWGSQNLILDNCSRTIRQVIVAIKAKQTKATVRETGQWPLGWVDWEYKTPNGKTLIEINDELPDLVASNGLSIVEALDTFYSTVGGTTKNTQSKQEAICDAWHKDIQKNTDGWAADLAQAPVYPPSIKQGFVRGSVCVYDRCCPSVGSTCPLGTGENVGGSQGLYTDASVQQAFAAAIDDLFIKFPYEEALDIYRKLVIKNPALRWALRADNGAVPTEVRKKLDLEMANVPWLEALPKNLNFKLAWLGSIYDYQQKMDTYGYKLQPSLTQQLGGSYYESPIQALINVIYPTENQKVYLFEPITNHVISVPEILGQSLPELQEKVYDIRDTRDALLDKYNETITSTIDNGAADKLTIGKEYGPGGSQRIVSGYFTCDDPYFSSQKATTIEQYALGTRYGCYTSGTSAGLCDGTKFEAIIKNSLWKEPLPAAKQLILNSKMFVGGKLNPDLEAAYARASEETGVPCEVLAGHHFEEGSAAFTEANLDPTKVSVANGGPASQDGGLENSAIIAANAILRNPFSNYQELIRAMSFFNGGGNANCGASPYSGCPKKFDGEDDPYAMNMIDAKHNSMYLIYCGDFQKCAYGTPYGTDRPGAFAVALVVHEYIQSTNPPPKKSDDVSTEIPQTVRDQIDPTGKCGGNAIDTALGCLPYERTAAIAAILRLLGGTAGALALGSMLFATFLIMTGAGDPKKVQRGRELFSSAILGLLFLIFAGAILRIVAQQVLHLPGF